MDRPKLVVGAATVLSAGFLLGTAAGVSVANQPPPEKKVIQTLHSVEHVPGPTQTVYAAAPLSGDCESAISIIHQIENETAHFTKYDGPYLDNLQAGVSALAQHESPDKINKIIETERKLQGKLNPTVTSIYDLESDLAIAASNCRKSIS